MSSQMLWATHNCCSRLSGWWGAGIQVVQELLSCPPQRCELVSGWGFKQQGLVPLSALYQLLLLKDFWHNLHSLWLLPLLEFPEKGKSTTFHYTEMRSCIPQHTARESTHTLLHGVGVKDIYVGEERRGQDRGGEGRRGRTLVYALSPLVVSVGKCAWYCWCLGPAGILAVVSVAALSSWRFLWLCFVGPVSSPKEIKPDLIKLYFTAWSLMKSWW